MKFARIAVAIAMLALCFAHPTVLANDLNRQFSTQRITEILVGEGSTQSMRIASSRPISLGLATIFVSPNGGKLSFNSALNLAEELSYKGWHIDVISPSWMSIPIIDKAMMSDKSMMMNDDKMASENMKDTAMKDAAMMKDDTMTETSMKDVDIKDADKKDSMMADKSMMMSDDKMAMKDATMMSRKPAEPWMSSLESDLDFSGLSEHLFSVLSGLETNSNDVAGFRLVIAEGVVAALLLSAGQQFDSESDQSIADAITLIAPFWPQMDTNQSLAELGANLPLPVLDLNIASANRFANLTAQQRSQQAKVNVKLDYRQRMLPAAQRYNAMDWIGGEIVGWTRSLGW